MSAHQQASEQFAALAARLRGGRSVADIQQIVVDSAVDLIDGADRAGIGVLDGAKFHSGAATDEVMVFIDELQDQVGEGPCLEASTDGVARVDNDITVHSTWPRLAELVVRQTPVRAMMAVPLIDHGARSGALNVFADRTDAFDQQAVTNAAILASFASVAMAGAHQSARADQLEDGMLTNREIGAAIGILMATHNISHEQAFELLRSASQRLNRKLRDIAGGIVRGDRGTTDPNAPGDSQ